VDQSLRDAGERAPPAHPGMTQLPVRRGVHGSTRTAQHAPIRQRQSRGAPALPARAVADVGPISSTLGTKRKRRWRPLLLHGCRSEAGADRAPADARSSSRLSHKQVHKPAGQSVAGQQCSTAPMSRFGGTSLSTGARSGDSRPTVASATDFNVFTRQPPSRARVSGDRQGARIWPPRQWLRDNACYDRGALKVRDRCEDALPPSCPGARRVLRRSPSRGPACVRLS
jgi:hypothetical protein